MGVKAAKRKGKATASGSSMMGARDSMENAKIQRMKIWQKTSSMWYEFATNKPPLE